MARFAVLLTLAAVVLALPAEGSTVPVKVKNTSGWIEAITMDGARVAYDVRGELCNKLFVWNVRTDGGALVSGKKTCMYPSVTDGTETFTDDRNGLMIGSLGGTGTINYASVDSVTASGPYTVVYHLNARDSTFIGGNHQ